MLNVIDDLQPSEVAVQDEQNRAYRLRITPYRTMDNRIEGVVITLIDIDQMKRTIYELEEARDFARLTSPSRGSRESADGTKRAWLGTARPARVNYTLSTPKAQRRAI